MSILGTTLLASLTLSQALSQETPASTNLTVLFGRAQKLQSEGALTEARRIYEQLLPQLRTTKDRKTMGAALNALSLINSELGEYSRALELAREAVEIRRALGDKIGEARSTNNMGLALLHLGDYPKALEYFGRALALDRAHHDAEGEIIRLNNIGNVFYLQGKYLDALRHYQGALECVNRTTDAKWNPHRRQLTTANLAVLFQKLGQYERALDLYLQLRAMPNVLSPSESGQILASLGALYRHLGDPIKALATYREAQKLFELQRHYDGEIRVLKNIGIALALDLNNLSEALQSFQKAAALAGKTSNRHETAQSLLYSAEVLRRMNRLGEARSKFTMALEKARDLGATEEQWKALYGLGRLAESEGSEDALNYLQSALTLIESVRSRLRLSSLKSDFLADKRDVYDALLELLVRPHKKAARWEVNPPEPSGFHPFSKSARQSHEEIFQLMERGRARTFQDQLHESFENLQAQLHPALTQSMREVRSQMVRLWSQQLRSGAAENARLQSELSDLERRYVEIERRHHELSQQTINASGTSLDAVQSSMDDSTVLMEFWTGPRDLAILWISRSDAGLIVKELPEEIARKVLSCAANVSQFSSENWRASCEGLGEFFFDGFLTRLGSGVKNLIIVPDEDLCLLPFEVLPLTAQTAFLIDRFNISYLPSASMLREPTTTRRLTSRMPWARTLLAFGDPKTFEHPQEPQDGVILEQGLPQLPHSAHEVATIARQVAGRKEVHLGADALKKYLFAEQAKSVPLIHLSTHATVDADNPQRSRILFSPERSPTGVDYLFLGEIFNWDLRGTELVTLSACETARGKMVRGEGAQDFSRAFLTNGARATVATLWRVADQPTSEFMKQFYFFLSQGYSKAESLRRAKLKFIHSGGPLSHPYYWAAFVLTGDGASKVSLPISWSVFFALSGLLLAAALCALWLIRNLTKKPL